MATYVVKVTADLLLSAETGAHDQEVSAIQRWRTAAVSRRAVEGGGAHRKVSEVIEIDAPNVISAKERAVQDFSRAAFDAGLPPAPCSLGAEVTLLGGISRIGR
jgi:hypothetical protein